jgi:membrane protease YdiL (CAAX protease family)
MRSLINRNFQTVGIGLCSPTTFLVTTSLIALAHGEGWPQALTSGTILGLWFIYTRSLGNVMAAHSIANLVLGVYVLFSKCWQLW